MQFQHQFFDKNAGVSDVVFNVSTASRVKQIHSNKVIKIDTPMTDWIEADALVTDQPNLTIGVITADCTPVLFYSSEGVIGAAHAGWQGAVNGILENTVEAMDCDPKTIQTFIGPCISQKSYEVSLGFEKPFLDHDKKAKQFFINGNEGKLQFDLAGYCAFRLSLCGVGNIIHNEIDTLTNVNYHSYRGGAMPNERNLSVIMINS